MRFATAPTYPVAASGIAAEAYAPYGELVRPGFLGRPVNRGEALRHDRVAALASLRADAAANLAVFEIRRRGRPLVVDWLERHSASTQVFLPLSPGRYLVVVAGPTKELPPDPASARAFLAPDGTGITYRPGVWHHGLMPLDRPMRFAMLVWEDEGPGDCEVADLPWPLRVEGAPLV